MSRLTAACAVGSSSSPSLASPSAHSAPAVSARCACLQAPASGGFARGFAACALVLAALCSTAGCEESDDNDGAPGPADAPPAKRRRGRTEAEKEKRRRPRTPAELLAEGVNANDLHSAQLARAAFAASFPALLLRRPHLAEDAVRLRCLSSPAQLA